MSEALKGYPAELARRGALDDTFVDRWNQRVSGMSLGAIQEQIEDGIEEVGGHRIFIDRGDDKDAGIITYGEWSVGMLPRVYLGAVAARENTNPGATIAIIANNTKGETYLNLSAGDEVRMLFGSPTPLVEIGQRVYDYIGNPSDLVIAGASQGSIPALADLRQREGAAGALIEIPTVIARDPIRLGLHTNGNGKSGEALIHEMYAETNPALYAEIMEHKPEEDAQFMAGTMLPSNIAALGILMRGNAKRAMGAALDAGNSIAHGYGNVDRVSPFGRNERIRQAFDGRPNYAAVPALKGEVMPGMAEHCVSGHALYVAAMTKLAYELPRTA